MANAMLSESLAGSYSTTLTALRTRTILRMRKILAIRRTLPRLLTKAEPLSVIHDCQHQAQVTITPRDRERCEFFDALRLFWWPEENLFPREDAWRVCPHKRFQSILVKELPDTRCRNKIKLLRPPSYSATQLGFQLRTLLQFKLIQFFVSYRYCD